MSNRTRPYQIWRWPGAANSDVARSGNRTRRHVDTGAEVVHRFRVLPRSISKTLRTAMLVGCGMVAIERCAAEVTFNRDILPILTTQCFSCHGPDASSREADLRLDREGNLRDVLDELVNRITSGDPDEQMPPPDSGKVLTSEQIETLEHWVESGADWERHWSLKPLERPSVPDMDADTNAWSQNPIDRFIAAKQAAMGLTRSKPADALTLIRRLSFDLVGLPPTPEEIASFVSSAEVDMDGAVEALVDRLLSSPHFGERWARHWLDVVKYADTCGYDKDKLRPNAWPYRDYVIRSFNEDKPYARFVEEQLAGDALFPETSDGILGLGFLAAGPWDFIGHVEVPETKIDGRIARHIDRDEMVSNTLNTFTSATIQCARCHDHKFDLITQRHYYGLQAVFAAVDRADRPYDLPREVIRKRRLLAERVEALKVNLESIDAEIEDAGGVELIKVRERIAKLEAEARNENRVTAFGYHGAIAGSPDETKWVQVDLGGAHHMKRVVIHPSHDDFAGIGGGFGFPVRFRLEASMDSNFGERILIADQTNVDFANPGTSPVVYGTDTVARFIRVTATRLAERQDDYIFALAEIEVFDPDGRNLAREANVAALDSIEAPVRWSTTNLTDGIHFASEDLPCSDALRTAFAERERILSLAKTRDRVDRREAVASDLERAELELKELPVGTMVYAAATHFKPEGNFKPTEGVPRQIHVLHRGDVTSMGEPATPGVIPLFGDESVSFDLRDDSSESDRRAALARWITRKDHPLTWRSIVNRIWLWHFGKGLVGTPNDFGRMGQPPSHPELLDWLACEFRDSGGGMKHLHRLIVTSATYRQSSSGNPENSRVDAENRHLWRMNRRRLEAEELRDAILAVSGRLDLAMGGPGFRLFELEKAEHSPHYEYHKFDPADPSSHRRSIYRFVVRSQPDPFMTTLDCADSNQSTPVRGETVTSLQALSLLNNPFVLHMAERFADRLAQEASGLNAQVKRGHELITGRRPTESEQALLVGYAERHGLQNLCRVLFNLSEFNHVD